MAIMGIVMIGMIWGFEEDTGQKILPKHFHLLDKAFSL